MSEPLGVSEGARRRALIWLCSTPAINNTKAYDFSTYQTTQTAEIKSRNHEQRPPAISQAIEGNFINSNIYSLSSTKREPKNRTKHGRGLLTVHKTCRNETLFNLSSFLDFRLKQGCPVLGKVGKFLTGYFFSFLLAFDEGGFCAQLPRLVFFPTRIMRSFFTHIFRCNCRHAFVFMKQINNKLIFHGNWHYYGFLFDRLVLQCASK